jgi:hypothetical protein
MKKPTPLGRHWLAPREKWVLFFGKSVLAAVYCQHDYYRKLHFQIKSQTGFFSFFVTGAGLVNRGHIWVAANSVI